MKALTLYHPWARFMELNIKKNETRSWATTYRGDLAICSAVKKLDQAAIDLATYILAPPHPLTAELPLWHFGCVLCVVDLWEIVPVSEQRIRMLSKTEVECGDYSLGRFCWLTRNCRRLAKPVFVVGRQGMFNLTVEQDHQVALEVAAFQSGVVDRQKLGTIPR